MRGECQPPCYTLLGWKPRGLVGLLGLLRGSGGRLRQSRLSCLGSSAHRGHLCDRKLTSHRLLQTCHARKVGMPSAHCKHISTLIPASSWNMDAHISLCRSAAMPRASVFRVPIVSRFRSNAASRPPNERRRRRITVRNPEIRTGTSIPLGQDAGAVQLQCCVPGPESVRLLEEQRRCSRTAHRACCVLHCILQP